MNAEWKKHLWCDDEINNYSITNAQIVDLINEINNAQYKHIDTYASETDQERQKYNNLVESVIDWTRKIKSSFSTNDGRIRKYKNKI